MREMVQLPGSVPETDLYGGMGESECFLSLQLGLLPECMGLELGR